MKTQSTLPLETLCRALCCAWLVPIAFSLSPASAWASDNGSKVTTLHSFMDGSTVDDGWTPMAPLVLGLDGNFYGTTHSGGSTTGEGLSGWGYGAVFSMTPSGTVTTIHSFLDGSVANDGQWPESGLVQAADGTLYGTTPFGGSAGEGTVFSITTAGAVTILHSFGDDSVVNDGIDPESALTLGTDGNLYGTTWGGGSASKGVVYAVTPAGTVTILHSFGDGSVVNDGAYPQSHPVQVSATIFYGTTYYGGSTVNADPNHNGYGAAYSFDTSSGALTLLHSFGDGTVANDGWFPVSGVILGTDGNLWGTTQYGGSTQNLANSNYGFGTVYKMSQSGTVTIEHSFNDGSVSGDAIWPLNPLYEGADKNFYGTSPSSMAGIGAAYRITKAGVVTILHEFFDGSTPNDGWEPYSGLVEAGGIFYGTCVAGGSTYGIGPNNQGYGDVYKLGMVNLVASSLAVSPGSVTGGSDATATIDLNATVDTEVGEAVDITTSDPAVVLVPASITIPQGAWTASFNVSTMAVTKKTTVTIWATAGRVKKGTKLSVLR